MSRIVAYTDNQVCVVLASKLPDTGGVEVTLGLDMKPIQLDQMLTCWNGKSNSLQASMIVPSTEPL